MGNDLSFAFRALRCAPGLDAGCSGLSRIRNRREYRDFRSCIKSPLIARTAFPGTLAYHGSAVGATVEVVSGNFQAL